MKLHNFRILPTLFILLAIFTANAEELPNDPSFSPTPESSDIEDAPRNARNLAVDVSNWKNFEKLIDSAEMAGYFTLEQVDDIISQLEQQFPELFLPLEIIGQTYEKHDIKLHCITKKTGNTTLEQESSNKSIGMITALHHPREPMSLSMLMFTFYRILVEYNQKNPEYEQLLNDNIMCFMPAFNVDGYLAIEKYYKEFQKFVKIRKNRNPSIQNCPRTTDIGVDLNRNYGYGWDMPGDGSSTNPCQEDYRGPSPFSEPETQAMKAFVEKYQTKLKLIANLHAYGNLWIYPFNCYVDDKPYKNKRITSIFDEFKEKAPLPEGAVVGNAKTTVQYTANGEASDWLLGTFGIISFSPEIGLIQRDANGFFPNKDVIFPVVSGDYDALFYMASKLNPKIELQGMGEKKLKDRKNRRSINMNLFNNAYRDIPQASLQLEVKVEGIREGFLGNILIPEIYIIQSDMDNVTETSTPVSVGNIVTTKFKATNSISYDVKQPFEFKSWTNTQVSVMVPHEDYESLHFELKVVERGHELYNYTQDFGGNQPISVMHNFMILVGSLAFAILVTVAIIYGTQYYHNKVKATKSHNMYGTSKPEKGLEFAQIGEESSVESSRI